MKYEVHIKGLEKCALLFAKPPFEIKTRVGGQTKNLSLEDQAKSSLYFNGKGVFAPARWFEGAMMKTASDFKLEGKKTFKDLVKMGVFVKPAEILLKTKQKKYEVFARIMRKQTGEAQSIANAKYNDWEFEFEIETLDPNLDYQQSTKDDPKIIEILKRAGYSKGVGGWHPRFGRFEVVSYKKI